MSRTPGRRHIRPEESATHLSVTSHHQGKETDVEENPVFEPAFV